VAELFVCPIKSKNLTELKKGIAQELIEKEKDQHQVVRWDVCLKHFIRCEYFEKVEHIVEERMGGLDALTKSDYNLYEMGWKIILKSLLNMPFLDKERDKWSQTFKKYLTILTNNIEAKIHDQTKSPHIQFKYSQNQPIKLGSEIYDLFKHLSEIYDNHPIFSNDDASEKMDLTGIKIPELCDYFPIWQKDVVPLHDYVSLRERNYSEDIVPVKEFVENPSVDRNEYVSAVKVIEQKELLALSLLKD
jgi:hypothetical protein